MQTNRGLFKKTRNVWARLYQQLGTWSPHSVVDCLTDSLNEAGKLIQDVAEEYSTKNLLTWDLWEQACCGPSFDLFTCTGKGKGPWKRQQMELFPAFFVLSCFTEGGNRMISLIALKRCINYVTAVHYANEESSHDFVFKISCNFLLLIQKSLVRSTEQTWLYRFLANWPWVQD